jgi:predicted PurR-regulated permease PerM
VDAPVAEAQGGGDDRPARVDLDLDPRSFIGLGAAALAALVVFGIARSAPVTVTRVAVGLLVGIALTPLASLLERTWEVSRATAAAIVGSGIAVVFAVVLVLVGPAAVRQAETFSGEVPATVEELYSWPIIGQRLEEADAKGTVEEWIEELPARLDEETLADFGERLLGGFVTAMIVLIVALGVLFDGEQAVRRVRTILPERVRPRADRVGHVVYETFGSYFAGSLVVAGLNGLVILTAGLALGVPLAPIAGLWAVFTNLIPQIGGFLGGSFFVLLALTDSPVKAAIAVVVFLGYQQLENNFIQPAVVGQAVNLSPPATMLAALVGGAAAGVPGALVATPLLGAAKAVYLERQGKARPRKEPVKLLQRFRGGRGGGEKAQVAPRRRHRARPLQVEKPHSP